MDGTRFDRLIRAMHTQQSRRGLAALFSGLALGGSLAVREVSANKKKRRRRRKNRNRTSGRPFVPPCVVNCGGKNCGGNGCGGSCGLCAQGFVCSDETSGGLCVCPGGTTECTGRCVDVTSDAGHCGSCGTTCPGGTTCLHGACATTTCANPSPPGNCSGASCDGATCPGTGCGTCDRTTEGQVICVNLGPPCDQFQGCSRTADCPLGLVCVTNGCCTFVGKPTICARPV